MRNKMLLLVCLAVITGCGPSTAPTSPPSPHSTSGEGETLATATEVAPDPCDARIAPTPTPLPAATPGGPAFDPDTNPPIEVIHTPPVVLRPDEKVILDFQIVCGLYDGPGSCQPEATLYAGWGDGRLEPVEMEPSESGARAAVPATDEGGRPLRYYAEVRDPLHRVGIRYPAAGCFEPLVVASTIEVHAPAPQPVEPEVALHLPWGQAEGQVGVNPAAMVPEGPVAFDVGPDGTIIVLDNVNSRAIVARPGEGRTSSFPVADLAWGDIAFDGSQQVAVLDAYGEPLPGGVLHIPMVRLYRLDGTPVAEAPVFARLPDNFVGSRSVLDGSDGQLVTPLDDLGRALSRDEQRAARRPLELQQDYLDERHYLFLLVDMPNRLAFKATGEGIAGGAMLFERAGDGYVAVFRDTGVFRILRFGRDGAALSFVEVPAKDIKWGIGTGSMTAAADGSIYYMNPAGEAVDILRAPPAASRGP